MRLHNNTPSLNVTANILISDVDKALWKMEKKLNEKMEKGSEI